MEDHNGRDDEKQILQYIHKKFNHVRKGSPSCQSPLSKTNHTIENIIRSVNIKSEEPSSQGDNPFNVPQRQSVIVRRKPEVVHPVIPKTSVEIEFENVIKMEDEQEDDQPPLKISLDLFELENLYRQEENAFFQQSLGQFEGCWKTIPMGEEMMNHYVSFCQRRQTLPFEFIKLIQNQVRYNFVNFRVKLANGHHYK